MENIIEDVAVAYLKTDKSQSEGATGFSLIEMSRNGLLSEQLHQLRASTGLDLQSFADILQVTPRTLQKKSPTDNMGLSISEKAIDLARLYAIGSDLFGSKARFTQWLKSDVPAMNGQRPLSLLDTRFGFELVEETLGRMSHGILS